MRDTDVERTIWPTYALRAWLGALVAHVRRSRHDLEARIDAAEKEVARLRRQHERAGSVIESLEDSIGRVDARLRQTRDTEPPRSFESHGEPARGGPEHGQEQEPARREHGARDDPDKKARDPGPSGEAAPSPTRGPGRRR
jgi:hypothetical protein